VLVATFFVMMDIPITRALGSTPGGSTGITGQLWFNVCTAPFQSTMQTWWNSSPYWDIGLYIGGPDLSSGCKSSNLTAKWISNVNDQGWSFVPTWIGPQSHCATVGTYGTYISNDTTTAYNQGVTAADDAYTAAASLGFSSGSVIYDDIEGYSATSTCGPAANAFVRGWSTELSALGDHVGIYGNPGNASDWFSLSPHPADVWIAAWVSGTAHRGFSVWNLTGLPNGDWQGDQRHHQFHGDHHHTYGYVEVNPLDDNCGNGLAAPSGSGTLETEPAGETAETQSVTYDTSCPAP